MTPKHPGGRPPKYPDEGGRQRPATVYLTPMMRAYVLAHGPTVSAGVQAILRRMMQANAELTGRRRRSGPTPG